MTDLYGASPLEWVPIVRRARIDLKLKAACLIFASYAEVTVINGYQPGERIYVGIARFATDCDVSYPTAQRYLRWMREVGLIELVKRGSPQLRLNDEYRLTLSIETITTIKAPTPDQYKILIDDAITQNRRRQNHRHHPGDV